MTSTPRIIAALRTDPSPLPRAWFARYGRTVRTTPEPATADLPADPAPAISDDQRRFDARPAKLRPRARRGRTAQDERARKPFAPDGRNRAYVDWLVEQSMLADATVLARQLAGHHLMWANAFAAPRPRGAVEQASVWYTAYPLSMITAPGQSFLGALGSGNLWRALAEIGIDAIHTGPVKVAGGLSGWEATPSIDGHFDRISMAIDPLFGTEDEYREMCAMAASYGGTVIDDIVPGHTGKGADFRLAELNYHDYPGIYHMIDIPMDAWHLLPDVPEGADSVNLSPAAERALADRGYIIGELQRVIFYEPGVKETNWSATAPIRDHRGVVRRWVYLHYFKEGQPSINWLDPTCAGMRLVMGDALHSLLELGAGGLRLDANGFLGVEKSPGAAPAWSEGHPLSQAANQLLGSMVRKVGCFTFQELNLSVDDIVATAATGPDLSYDFVTRPAYQVALCTGDTEFLRLTLREGMRIGIDQASLIHALQNHDELTYELVHFATRHAEDEYVLGGRVVKGRDLAEQIRQVMRDRLTGDAGPYNATFTQNGIASTTASVVAASLGFTDPSALTDAAIQRIMDAHLLLSMYNAFQPGVFALSGWDLVGALPLHRNQVETLIKDGDTRWIERGAYDLLGVAPDATHSSSGMPRAVALYGSLPEQLGRPDSFACRLAGILAVRKDAGIATGALIDVPEVSHRGLLVLVNLLGDETTQVTVLNFGAEPLVARVQSAVLPVGHVVDLATRRPIAQVDDRGGFEIGLPAFGGCALVVRGQADADAVEAVAFGRE